MRKIDLPVHCLSDAAWKHRDSRPRHARASFDKLNRLSSAIACRPVPGTWDGCSTFVRNLLDVTPLTQFLDRCPNPFDNIWYLPR